MYIADLHLHSRYSRATSKDCDMPHLDWWARRKGIQLLGTGDFTHPAWRAELKEQLEPAGDGVYILREKFQLPNCTHGVAPRFVVTGEISSIYKRDGRTRKVHNLILLPSLEAADELSARLEAIGNLHSDGRPILGIDSRDLLELMLDVCPDAEFIPAHIWTPHFSMFGEFSGFHSIKACFDDMSPYIHAVETGLSSDPPMNWRVSALDGLTLVSHSDAHSPAKLGREANILDTGLTYPELVHAIRTGEGFMGTVEFFPEEGKYHLDGHRNCGVCLTPVETAKLGGICPVCGKKLTIGVENRVEALADRPMDFRPKEAKPFESLAPLPEAIAASIGSPVAGKRTLALYEQMLNSLGAEFYILRQAPIQDIEQIAGACVAEGIRRLRLGHVERRPGFDGSYGTISLLSPSEMEQFSGQVSLYHFEAPKKNAKAQSVRAISAQVPASEIPQLAAEQALTPEQQAAASSRSPAVAVVAGPGTGKTKTLVARIAYLVQNLGVKPSEITAVTFTNQAASEMRQRLEKQLGGKRAIMHMTIGTFHAICLQLLKKVQLIDQSEALTIAADVLHTQGKKGSARELLQAVSRVKSGASLKAVDLSEEVYLAYCNRLKNLGVLDFDDLLTEVLQLKTIGQKRFTHLLVDEFQDINKIQYALIRAWSQHSKSLFVIGDPDQSIYGFRGADGLCFAQLMEDFPDAQQIRLTINYRSTPQILEAAQSIIDKNPGVPRKLSAHISFGASVRLIQATDSYAESIFIAKEIGRMVGGIDMLEAQKLGHDRMVRPFSDIAVLCRTHRQLSLIEKCLQHDDIPCIICGRDDFLEEEQVRGPLSFLHFLQAPGDLAALETALRLLWDCPADLIEKAQQVCKGQPELKPALLRPMVQGFGHLEAWLARVEEWLAFMKEKPRKLVERWQAQYGTSPALEKLRNTAVFYSNFQELWNALTLGQEADLSRASGRGWESGAVHLMTLHGSKGLEFPAVLIAGVTAGSIPYQSQQHQTNLEEERRLLYVGMTRAREELILTTNQNPSPFLCDLPKGVLMEKKKNSHDKSVSQLSLF